MFSTKSITVLVYVTEMPNPKYHLNSESQFADDSGLWAETLIATLAAHRLQEDLDAEAEWCANWIMKLNPEKNKWILFFRLLKQTLAEPALFRTFLMQNS